MEMLKLTEPLLGDWQALYVLSAYNSLNFNTTTDLQPVHLIIWTEIRKFKLRCRLLATAMNFTNKKYEVNWNGLKRSLLLTKHTWRRLIFVFWARRTWLVRIPIRMMTAGLLFWTLRPCRMLTPSRMRWMLTYIGSGRMLAFIWSRRMLTGIGSRRMLAHIRRWGMLTGIRSSWMSTACIGPTWSWADIRGWWTWASIWPGRMLAAYIWARTPWSIIRLRTTLRPCTMWSSLCNLQEKAVVDKYFKVKYINNTYPEVTYTCS